MSQPEWEEVGQVGDQSFEVHGGGLVFKDLTGVYKPELEYVEPPTDDEELDDPKARWTVYRVSLEGVPNWGDLKAVARSAGQDPKELRADFESEDPMRQALAYETWAGHYGWHELDQYPLSLTCSEMNKRYDVDIDCYGNIQSKLEETVQRLADAGAAQAWSTIGDREQEDARREGFDPDSLVYVAEFGDALGVNGDLELEKTEAGVESELEKEGYVMLDRGGRIPTTEEHVSPEHVIRAVAKEMELDEDIVKEAAAGIDWWPKDRYDEIPWSTSGHAYIWGKKDPDAHVDDGDYIVQGAYADGTIVGGLGGGGGETFGLNDEQAAIRAAKALLRDPTFEGDYVTVITRDGELVWSSRPEDGMEEAPRRARESSGAIVGKYLTKSGKTGALIRRDTGRHGTTYRYYGEWGAGSGHSEAHMRREIEGWLERKRGVQVEIPFKP